MEVSLKAMERLFSLNPFIYFVLELSVIFLIGGTYASATSIRLVIYQLPPAGNHVWKLTREGIENLTSRLECLYEA